MTKCLTQKKNLFFKQWMMVSSSVFAVVMMSSPLNAETIHSKSSHNNDPLSLQEVQAASLLTAGPTVAARTASNDDLSAITKSAQEILLIERNEEKGAPSDQRRADVYIYDYATNELIQSLVDLNTSTVISSHRTKGVQLPLTPTELKRAKAIVFDDEDELAIIKDEYRRITQKEMTNVSELNIKAFTFLADSLPNRVNEASKHCGEHRCAQLMLYTQDNVVFEISPIVNLSEGVVTQRIGF